MKSTIILLAILCFSACSEPNATKILGSWQIDSIYDYHNGFTFTNRSPHPREVYEYKTDNTVLRKGMGEQLEYHYTCHDSILKLSSSKGAELGEVTIVHLDDKTLALKENKKPLFPGKNEMRYEIRYFSRLDSAVLGR
jgi:hypothetical protein